MGGQYEFFLLKIPKMEGTTVKKLQKWTGRAVIFVIGIEKIGVLHFSRAKFILS